MISYENNENGLMQCRLPKTHISILTTIFHVSWQRVENRVLHDSNWNRRPQSRILHALWMTSKYSDLHNTIFALKSICFQHHDFIYATSESHEFIIRFLLISEFAHSFDMSAINVSIIHVIPCITVSMLSLNTLMEMRCLPSVFPMVPIARMRLYLVPLCSNSSPSCNAKVNLYSF